MSTKDVFKQFFSELVTLLPVDDASFLSKLYSCNLLPGNLMNQVMAKETREDKAFCFLNGKINCDISINDFRSFNKLVTIMKESGYDSLIGLAEKITALQKGTPSIALDDNNAGELPPKKKKVLSTLERIAEELRYRYLGQPPISQLKNTWPKHYVHNYVKLALIESEIISLEDDHIDNLTKLTLQGGVDMILKKKKPINELREIFHYNNEPIPRLILIMGGPGIGKTTLANEICKKWADREEMFLSEDFTIIILIALRTVQQRSLENVMIEQIGPEAYQEIMEMQGAKCLIILEGLDELAVEQQQNDALLLNLINISTFIKAVILITSRPYACQELNANRRIEIVGFGEEQIKSFVKQSFPNDSQIADKFMQQLMENPHIHSLCYIPVSLVMVLHIFRHEKQCLPSTLTKLYQQFTAMMLAREKKRVNLVSSTVTVTTGSDAESICCKAVPAAPKEMIGKLHLLSNLAFHGFFEREPSVIRKHDGWRKVNNPRIIFCDDDLTQCNIKITDAEGLLKVEIIHHLTEECVTYNFIHLTIQEFLCAVYMLTLSEQEQCHLLKEYFDDYPNIMILYCGLTKLDVHQLVYSNLTSYFSTVTAMKCLYEGRWNTALHKSISPFELNMSYITLLPYDCLCLSYVYCHYPVTKLNLYMCYIGSSIGMLAKWCLNKTTQLDELDLGENNLTSEGMKHTMKIVTSSPSLRVLDVSENNIGDDGISFCLQHTNSLLDISFEFCGFSAKGASYIKTMLMETTKLDYLHIGKNYIGNDGIKYITEGIQKNKTLTKLKAYDCGFSIKGAINISEMIKINHTLQYLNINSNPIGDEGIAAIATTLNNSTISELIMYNCDITVTGAKSISKMINLNQVLQYLDINSNPINDEGIAAIAKNLNNSRICELIVYNCGITVVGTKELAESLTNNYTIKSLQLEDNDITLNGAIVTLEAAITNGVCQKVEIKDRYKSDDKVKGMMTILQRRKRQAEGKRSNDVCAIATILTQDHHTDTATGIQDDQPQDAKP